MPRRPKGRQTNQLHMLLGERQCSISLIMCYHWIHVTSIVKKGIMLTIYIFNHPWRAHTFHANAITVTWHWIIGVRGGLRWSAEIDDCQFRTEAVVSCDRFIMVISVINHASRLSLASEQLVWVLMQQNVVCAWVRVRACVCGSI